MTDTPPARQRLIIHSVLAVLAPFLFLWIGVIRYAGNALSLHGIDLFAPLLPGLLFFTAMVEIASGEALERKRIGGLLPRIRELLVILLIAFASIVALFGEIASLIRGAGIDLARVEIWVSLGLVALQWILTYVLQTKLREREAFTAFFTKAAPERYSEIYAAHSYEAGSSLHAIGVVRRITIALQLVAVALVVVSTWPLAYAPGPWDTILAAILFGALFFAIGILSRFVQVQDALSSGRVISPDDVFRRDAVALILLAILMGAAAVLAGQRPFLPVELFAIAWSWLVSLRGERAEIGPIEPPGLGSIRESDEFNLEPSLNPDVIAGGNRPNPLEQWLPWIALGAGVALVIAFLVTPLLRKDQRDGGVRGFLRAIGQRVHGFIQAIRIAVQRIGGMARQSQSAISRQVRLAWKAGTERISRRRKHGKTALRDVGTRRTENRAVRHFMRLVKWGESHGAPFTRSVAPLEYAARVSARAPDHQTQLYEAAAMFEQIVFSSDHGGESLLGKYQKTINEIVASK